MKILGIESTAHTFSIAIAEKKNREKGKKGEKEEKIKILSNVSDKYPSTLEGYIPRKLADHHAEVFSKLLKEAISKANISLSEIDAVAYSQGSGIGHCLHVGFVAAKALSSMLDVPLVPVNHSVGHIEIGKELYCKTNDPLVVYVSGGNTQIMTLDKTAKRYHVYGETIDIGIGNFVDVLGRTLKLTPPDAVGVVRAAEKGKQFIDLPYTVRGMNLAFSGLQTYIEKKVLPEVANGKYNVDDVAFSAQETAFAMLCETVERALCHTNKKEVLLCGGNARNQRLQEMLKSMADEHKVNFAVTSFEHSGDQAAMIALTGIKMLEAKCPDLKSTIPRQRFRTDASCICW
ncbi:MAG: tRNA (adenosine(37)-N6)-threonylcarbamoyltransferase complex transferase subunit TsaD [Candidatus Micrarchaeota archaeon]|nr:tRNA (adenosine(37)-N6)-threonylcarbamoyltransferase complex transferase subunit TsaD [Candidatus Micrarchaeota archaeon]